MSTHQDVMHLIEFIESICDETMLEEHNLARPIARLKPPLIPVDSMRDIIGRCEVCDREIDRYDPWFEGNINGALIKLCDNCRTNNSDEELAEIDILTCE